MIKPLLSIALLMTGVSAHANETPQRSIVCNYLMADHVVGAPNTTLEWGKSAYIFESTAEDLVFTTTLECSKICLSGSAFTSLTAIIKQAGKDLARLTVSLANSVDFTLEAPTGNAKIRCQSL